MFIDNDWLQCISWSDSVRLLDFQWFISTLSRPLPVCLSSIHGRLWFLVQTTNNLKQFVAGIVFRTSCSKIYRGKIQRSHSICRLFWSETTSGYVTSSGGADRGQRFGPTWGRYQLEIVFSSNSNCHHCLIHFLGEIQVYPNESHFRHAFCYWFLLLGASSPKPGRQVPPASASSMMRQTSGAPAQAENKFVVLVFLLYIPKPNKKWMQMIFDSRYCHVNIYIYCICIYFNHVYTFPMPSLQVKLYGQIFVSRTLWFARCSLVAPRWEFWLIPTGSNGKPRQKGICIFEPNYCWNTRHKNKQHCKWLMYLNQMIVVQFEEGAGQKNSWRWLKGLIQKSGNQFLFSTWRSNTGNTALPGGDFLLRLERLDEVQRYQAWNPWEQATTKSIQNNMCVLQPKAYRGSCLFQNQCIRSTSIQSASGRPWIVFRHVFSRDPRRWLAIRILCSSPPVRCILRILQDQVRDNDLVGVVCFGPTVQTIVTPTPKGLGMPREWEKLDVFGLERWNGKTCDLCWEVVFWNAFWNSVDFMCAQLVDAECHCKYRTLWVDTGG